MSTLGYVAIFFQGVGALCGLYYLHLRHEQRWQTLHYELDKKNKTIREKTETIHELEDTLKILGAENQKLYLLNYDHVVIPLSEFKSTNEACRPLSSTTTLETELCL